MWVTPNIQFQNIQTLLDNEKKKKEGIVSIFSTSPILPLDVKLDTQYKEIKSHTIQISRTLTTKKNISKPN